MPETAYNGLDRLLHRLALGYPTIAEMSFELDQLLAPHDVALATRGHHVFVAGLARAGTTILMREVHASGEFRSLTYRDMPFVLAPRLWARLSSLSRKNTDLAERAHGDGIRVDADSPESFDEVFWRVVDGDAYIGPDSLVPHAPSEKSIERFRAYVAAILDTGTPRRQRYLSKNNNNVLRLQAIARAFPNASILVPFRDPVQQADSLRRQHLRFCESQRADAFARSYMDWLGHHEFGLGHRPFVFREATWIRPGLDALEHWLREWVETYRWLLDTMPASGYAVCYEDLCEDDSLWGRVCSVVGIRCDATDAHPFQQARREPPQIRDSGLLATAQEIYAALRERARKSL
jgi:hypothetical protein